MKIFCGLRVKEKHLLNFLLVIILIAFEYGIIRFVMSLFPEGLKIFISDDKLNQEIINNDVYNLIAISLVLVWFGILIAYYMWSIYFYNINLGYTNEDWAEIRKRIKEAKKRQEIGESIDDDDLLEPSENPYRQETFGLPSGTVRGTLALSLLVGALALLIINIGNPDIYEKSKVFHDNFEFFKTAFLMMVAFYFGSKSLSILQNKSTQNIAPAIPPRGRNKKKNGDLPGSQQETISTELKEREITTISDIEDDTEDKNITKDFPHLTDNDNNKKLSEEDINNCAKETGIETAVLKAVIKVESSGSGFLKDGRAKILFEGHKFWKFLEESGINPAKHALEHPDILYKTWTRKNYLGGIREYERLEKAKLINSTAALKSASWGLFQIMGFNHKIVGFDTVEAFVEEQEKSEKNQLEAFVEFIKSQNLVDSLKNHDWKTFARKYNGPGYAKNHYDTRLEEYYIKYSRSETTNIKAELIRSVKEKKQTLGQLNILRNQEIIFTCKTLELPWKENKRNISCIPENTYKVKKRFTDKNKFHFHVQDVPGRDWILIHHGNYYTDIRGCILVGLQHIDIDSDGLKDVTSSVATLKKLNQILPEQFDLLIRS
ncbi:MAG: N-acetylmuramidase family protein [Bacteroidales bacterium]|nr:N-acetylmuramidase family protein [Bacteroidales bacterium]